MQHAHNPVDWFAWCDEAFKKARDEDKPIFLSIGYSTCHWCHVMAHESFEDPEVAALMNETFVNIKVDKEERPDLDATFMTVCQMMTQSGGWPLTIIMMPDKRPFFAATYIPKEDRFGRIGMKELIPRISELWQNNRAKIERSAADIHSNLHTLMNINSSGQLDEMVITDASRHLKRNFDKEFAGFGGAPKFPSPHTIIFLLRYWRHTGEQSVLDMAEQTLLAMRRGGMYDQIGFGFHRYSTDAQWLVPHFEKMLYDQAMLIYAYSEMYQATKNPEFRQTVEEIITYLLRDMRAPEGGFFTAEDADSEGEEGKFYVWSEDELQKILGESFVLAVKIFNIKKGGNFREETTGKMIGSNILHLQKSIDKIAEDENLSQPELTRQIETIREKLLAAREKRVRPHKDDKILTDWNGLMITALAKAGQVFNHPDYTEAAEKTVRFILNTMRKSKGELFHRFREGDVAIAGFVDDYAFVIWGLIELYETTFDAEYLKFAIELNEQMLELFWDEKEGGLFFTAKDAETVILRKKETYDGAIPSGNSVAMMNLLRLGRMTGNSHYEQKAAQIGQAFSRDIQHAPSGFTFLLSALLFTIAQSREIVIVAGADAADNREMIQAVRSDFTPFNVVLFKDEKNAPFLSKTAEFTSKMQNIDGKATAYICENFSCSQPVTSIEQLLEKMQR